MGQSHWDKRKNVPRAIDKPLKNNNSVGRDSPIHLIQDYWKVKIMFKHEIDELKFFQKTETTENGKTIWTGAVDNRGLPVITVKGQKYCARKIAYAIYTGYCKEVVSSKSDNPLCISSQSLQVKNKNPYINLNGHRVNLRKIGAQIKRDGDCLIWTGSTRRGRPSISTQCTETGKSKSMYVHAVLFHLKHPEYDGERLARTCRNNLCVNPDHMRFYEYKPLWFDAKS